MSNARLHSKRSFNQSQELFDFLKRLELYQLNQSFVSIEGNKTKNNETPGFSCVAGGVSPSSVLVHSVDTNIPVFGDRSILDNISPQTGKVDLNPVSGKNCRCRSVWCPDCFRILYKEKIQKAFEGFDYQFTRQVVLTVDPARFESAAAAFQYIRENRSVSEFIKRLRRGCRQKIGKQWVWKYFPVNVVRWAWFLEWHKSGFPHYHVFVMTDQKNTMIGGEFLRDSWKLSSWVREEYFRNEEHFKNLTGYYAGKGYFEKGKKYQGLLPEEILNINQSKIKRYGRNETGGWHKMSPEAIEKKNEMRNYKECMTYFDEMRKIRESDEMIVGVVEKVKERVGELEALQERKILDYRAMLQNCGKYTYVEIDIKEFRFTGICDLEWAEWKKMENGQFIQNKGYVVGMTKEQVVKILNSFVRVISIKEYMDVSEYIRRRKNKMDQEEYHQRNILMQG